MKFHVTPSQISGTVEIPGSKSHTIRALFFAMLANGESEIISPLASADTKSAFVACRAFGAKIDDAGNKWTVGGVGGKVQNPGHIIDVVAVLTDSFNLRYFWLTCISHHEMQKIVITPVLLRCGGDSCSVTYITVCSFANRLPRLVSPPFSRFYTRIGVICGLIMNIRVKTGDGLELSTNCRHFKLLVLSRGGK